LELEVTVVPENLVCPVVPIRFAQCSGGYGVSRCISPAKISIILDISKATRGKVRKNLAAQLVE